MRLSRINTLLLLLIVAVNGYLVIAPLWPALLFRHDSHGGATQRRLAAEVRSGKATGNTPVAQSNRLIVPAMLLDQPVLEGPVRQQYGILDKGIWRWPGGSTPDKGGNTVFIGHRFTYTNPRGVFYFLNKVKLNDEIGVSWNAKLYRYRVTDIKEVRPTDTAIEAGTTDSRLTLFTCTPLYLPKDRLVVVAELESQT